MVQMLKGDFIIFEGQDLFPLFRTVIKTNGIRFGIVFAFHPNLSETPALLCERKDICSFLHGIKHPLIHSNNKFVLCSYYVPDLGFDTRHALVNKTGLALLSLHLESSGDIRL